MIRFNPYSIAICLSALALSSTPLRAQEKIVAYVPNWVDLKSFSSTIEYAKLTHINIAFENPTDESGDFSFNPKDDVLIAKAHANNVKILVSIGGGAASTDKKLQKRYFDLLTEPKRACFVKKLSAYLTEHHFDGLDVDFEGPSINQDYGAFINDLSAELKPNHMLLTAALSQGYGGKNVPDSIFTHLDFVNVMAYDGAGYWDPDSPGQHASLEFAKSNVAYWLHRGLPPSKTVLGVPFYGYGFGPAFRKRDYPYSEILTAFPGAETVDRIGDTIWYNGIPTIRAKTQFAIDQKLAGIMIWSLDYDVPGPKSLLDASAETYKSTRAEPAKINR